MAYDFILEHGGIPARIQVSNENDPRIETLLSYIAKTNGEQLRYIEVLSDKSGMRMDVKDASDAGIKVMPKEIVDALHLVFQTQTFKVSKGENNFEFNEKNSPGLGDTEIKIKFIKGEIEGMILTIRANSPSGNFLIIHDSLRIAGKIEGKIHIEKISNTEKDTLGNFQLNHRDGPSEFMIVGY